MWNTISPDEIDLLPEELDALETIEGSRGVLAGILSRTIKAARGTIIAAGNRLGPEGTAPDQIRQEIIDIARWVWFASFPAMKSLATPERQRMHDQAHNTLAQIASGSIRVEVPLQAIQTPAPGNAAALLRPGRPV